MTKSIAVAGKGGTGKSTIAALLINRLCNRGMKPVLAVDADPDCNLGTLLGTEAEQTIGDLREDLLKTIKDFPAGMTKANYIESGLHQIIGECEGYDLITMGRPEGPGCYCYPNQVLRTILQTISNQYPAMVVDNEAGLEHLSRRLLRRLDLLLIVSGPSPRGLRTAARIRELVRELKIEVGEERVIINQAGREGVDWNALAVPLGFSISGTIPRDPLIEEYDLEERSLLALPDRSPALQAAFAFFRRVIPPISSGR